MPSDPAPPSSPPSPSSPTLSYLSSDDAPARPSPLQVLAGLFFLLLALLTGLLSLFLVIGGNDLLFSTRRHQYDFVDSCFSIILYALLAFSTLILLSFARSCFPKRPRRR